jgi:hypothetical protein
MREAYVAKRITLGMNRLSGLTAQIEWSMGDKRRSVGQKISKL